MQKQKFCKRCSLSQIKHPYLLLALFDGAFLLVASTAILCVCATPAYAYVDPSVMTYTIQAVAGVAVALGAVAGVAFRRSRNVIMRILHIDADAKKIKEEAVHRIDENDTQAFEDANNRAAKIFEAPNKHQEANTARNSAKRGLPWGKRIVLSLIVSAFLFFTLFVCTPTEMVQGNNTDLVFSLLQVFPTLIEAMLIATAILGLGLSVIRGRAFEIALAAIFACALCFYLQPLLLNTGLASADGHAVAWQDFRGTMFVNLLIWIAIMVAILIVRHFQPRITRIAALALSTVLIVMQCVGVISLYSDAANNIKLVGTNDGLLELSSKNNNVTFVLDTFDSSYAIQLQQLYPALYAEVTSEMDGFTFFPDTTAAYIPTRYALPYLITGQTQKQDESWETYQDEIYKRSSYLKNIANANYSIGVYSDSICMDSETAQFMAASSLSHKISATNINAFSTVQQLISCALYRDAPWVFKPFFWFTTDEVNTSSTVGVPTNELANVAYVMDDIEFYQQLTLNKLSIQTNDTSYTGAYRLIHLIGSHEPYIMDENCQENDTDVYHQTLGALRIVNEYLRQMKELGIYDSANITITADHGYWELTDQVVTQTSCPATYIKVSNSAKQGIAESAAELSQGDILATVATSIGFDGSEYGTYVFDINPYEERIRTFFWTLSDGYNDIGIQKYVIHGNALDINSWTATNEIWTIS